VGFHEETRYARGHGGAGQHGDELALAAGKRCPARPGAARSGWRRKRRGHFVSRMIERERMSETSCCSRTRIRASQTMMGSLPVERALSTTFFISHGERNCPFLMLTACLVKRCSQ